MRRRPDPTITAPSVFRRRDALAEAFAVLAQRPVRTLLTALGTILGVAAFVTTTGLAETASAQVSSRFDTLHAPPKSTSKTPPPTAPTLSRTTPTNASKLSTASTTPASPTPSPIPAPSNPAHSPADRYAPPPRSPS